MLKIKREQHYNEQVKTKRNEIFKQKRVIYKDYLETEEVTESIFEDIEMKQEENEKFSEYLIKDGYIEKALIYLDKYPELVLSTLVNCTFHEIVDVMILLNGIFNYLHYENCLIIVNNLAYKGYSKEIIQCGILNEFAAIMEEYPQHEELVCRILLHINGEDGLKYCILKQIKNQNLPIYLDCLYTISQQMKQNERINLVKEIIKQKKYKLLLTVLKDKYYFEMFRSLNLIDLIQQNEINIDKLRVFKYLLNQEILIPNEIKLSLLNNFQIEQDMIVLIEFIPIFELMIDDLLSEKGFLDMINEKLKEQPTLYQIISLYRVAIMKDQRYIPQIEQVKHILEQMHDTDDILDLLQ